ncbi:MAG: response regulator [Acetobacteraceae bacterium]|nr:response regulator [Acetobacteraceae bacterium]
MFKSCLVVDDSRTIRSIARSILEANDFQVAEASNGQLALEACRAALPDCVLLDWNMPVMNGMEFLRALRAEFGAMHPVVVLCTTRTELYNVLEAVASGAQEYIMKPFDAEILIGKLAQVGFA